MIVVEGEHSLFFPVVVLVALILIVLSFKLLFRLLLLCLVIAGLWYGLYYIGIAPSPFIHHEPAKKKEAETHV